MENEIDETIIDSTTNEPEVEPDEQTEVEPAPQEEETQQEPEKPQETPEAKFARLTRQADQLAKKHGFKPKQVEQPRNESALSSRDTIALINAKIHEDDVDDVLEYAKFKKIPVAEAIKSSVVRASLAEKQELRATANATNTGRTRAPNSRVSGEALLDKAQKTGELPDSKEALNAMLDARYSTKK